MKAKVDRYIESYADILDSRPFLILAIALLTTATLSLGATNVETVEQNQEDLLPESLPTMAAFETISSEFSSGSGTSYTVLIETDPEYANSSEIRDLRSPEVLRFTQLVSDDIRAYDRIDSVSGPSTLFDEIPTSRSGIKDAMDTLGESRWSNYISGDYTVARIQVTSEDLSVDEQSEMAQLIRESVEAYDRPGGLKISYSGQPYIDEAFQDQTQQTAGLTGITALLGVILVVVVLFRSVFYGLTSLLTLAFGITTGFGIFGLLGLNMSPATSGAITMGIGVAIDFGIQPIARYIEERESLDIRDSLSETVKGVITPMTVGLIAANIGFLSLNVGRVTFLSDLGTLLTLTTTMAYMSALTTIPVALIIYDRYFTEDGTSGSTLSKIRKNTQEEK